MSKNPMTNVVKWLHLNDYQPPFSKETIVKGMVARLGRAPSTIHGYLRQFKQVGYIRGAGLKNTYIINLSEVEKLEQTDLSQIKKDWSAQK